MSKNTKNIIVRLTEEEHQKLKEFVVRNKMTMQGYLLNLIREDQKRRGESK